VKRRVVEALRRRPHRMRDVGARLARSDAAVPALTK
jgi:hypothetical protein